jgi:MFS family permease
MTSESLSPLLVKEYRFFIFSRFFFVMALRMVATIVAYQLFQLTKSSFSIGVVGLSEFIPVVTLALYAGHIIDKSDKRTLLLKGVLSYCACVGALLLVTMPALFNKLSITFVEFSFYIIIFFTGIIRAFVGPTSHAIIAQLVPRNVLHSVQ